MKIAELTEVVAEIVKITQVVWVARIAEVVEVTELALRVSVEKELLLSFRVCFSLCVHFGIGNGVQLKNTRRRKVRAGDGRGGRVVISAFPEEHRFVYFPSH